MVVELTAAGSIVSVVCVHDTVVCVGSSKQQRMQHASRQTFLATCVCARCKFFSPDFCQRIQKASKCCHTKQRQIPTVAVLFAASFAWWLLLPVWYFFFA